MVRLRDGGFTLPELLVAVGFLVVAGLVVAWLLNPTDFTNDYLTASRRTDVAGIVQALNKYAANTGTLPPGVPTAQTEIGSLNGEYNLCKYLVPSYLPDLPIDAVVGVAPRGGKQCDASGASYDTGYTISRDQAGQLTIRSAADPTIRLTTR